MSLDKSPTFPLRIKYLKESSFFETKNKFNNLDNENKYDNNNNNVNENEVSLTLDSSAKKIINTSLSNNEINKNDKLSKKKIIKILI